jgi:hypothetical protein
VSGSEEGTVDSQKRATSNRIAGATDVEPSSWGPFAAGAGLAEEQAALRRVATLVAQQPSPQEVFTAVTEAVRLASWHRPRSDARVSRGWDGDDDRRLERSGHIEQARAAGR